MLIKKILSFDERLQESIWENHAYYKTWGLQQYLKRDNGTPRMAEQPGQSSIQKGKAIAEQRMPVAEQ